MASFSRFPGEKKKRENAREPAMRARIQSCAWVFSRLSWASFVSLESRQACLSQLTALNGISVSSQPLYYGAPEGTRKLKSLSVSPAKTKKSRVSQLQKLKSFECHDYKN